MYKIKMTCYDPPYDNPPYDDEVSLEFDRQLDAVHEALVCAVDEADSLMQPPPEDHAFVVCRNFEFAGKNYDVAVVIRYPDDEEREQFLTGYYIEWVNSNELDEYNRKLRDEFGESISVCICSEMGLVDEEDPDTEEHEVFYFSSSRMGESIRFTTPGEAYKEARDYLVNIDLYVD